MNDKKKFSFKPVCSSGEGITHVSAKKRGLADTKLTTQNHFLFRYLHTSHLCLFVAMFAPFFSDFPYVLLYFLHRAHILEQPSARI